MDQTASSENATLFRMLRCRARHGSSSTLPWLTAVLVFLLYFFAVSPACAIERFVDAKGIIHISNISTNQHKNSAQSKASLQSPERNLVQQRARQISQPKTASASIPTPKIASAAPVPQNIPGAASELPPAPSPAPRQVSATGGAQPQAQVKSEKESKAVGEQAAAGSEDKARAKHGPLTIPGNPTPEHQQVLEINTLEVNGEREPAIITAVARSTIGCYRDSQGILHITNVSILEPLELAVLQPGRQLPGKAPEARSEESPANLLLSISTKSWGEQERTPGENLAELNRPSSVTPKYIRAYPDSRGVLYIENQDPDEYLPQTVSA